MSNVHDHLWIDIFQHTHFFDEQDEKRIWKYRHHLIYAACKHGSVRAVSAMMLSGTWTNPTFNRVRAGSWC